MGACQTKSSEGVTRATEDKDAIQSPCAEADQNSSIEPSAPMNDQHVPENEAPENEMPQSEFPEKQAGEVEEAEPLPWGWSVMWLGSFVGLSTDPFEKKVEEAQ